MNEHSRLFDFLYYQLANFPKADMFSAKLDVLHFAPEPVFADLLSKQRNITYVSGDLNPAKAGVCVDITNIQFEDEQGEDG